MKQEKQVILITGASAGMGKAFVKQLMRDGHIVYGTARRLDKMEDLRQAGVRTMKMDVTDDASMVHAIDEILKTEGRVDVLINNAGFGSYGAIEDVPMAEARYQLEVNVVGAARLIQLVLPAMRSQRYGRIINISSIGGKIATPFGGWYHASKFALEGLSDSLRLEVAPFGIDVVVIEPGGIKSEWGSIAVANLEKTSHGTVYGPTAKKFGGGLAAVDSKVPGPDVITRLVQQAINAKKPKTRYSGGYMAKPALMMRKILPDRIFDKMMMSQIK